LGQTEPFFHRLVSSLVDEMGDAYPELRQQQQHIEQTLLAEEQRFALTLEKGMAVLEATLGEISGAEIPGEVVFTLHDTYGFPTDLTNDIARERNFTLDMAGFDRLMAIQKQQSGASSKFDLDYTKIPNISGQTEFVGYNALVDQASVVAIIVDGTEVETLTADTDAVIVLNKTPFYAESGGQVGDSGFIESVADKGVASFEVRDCQKNGAHHLHVGRLLKGKLSTGDVVKAQVDNAVRQATALNHSATHLLHAALRLVLGEHVSQKGSLVDSEKLRFDFSHGKAVSAEQLMTIETIVNDQIRANTAVLTEICSMDAAKAKGAMALFGEKYGNSVRVLTMGAGFSIELCGGTHVRRSGDIGLLRIVSESGIAAGVRRIEALTGGRALAYFDQLEKTVNQLNHLFKTKSDRLLDKAQQVLQSNRQMEKEISRLQSKLATSTSEDIVQSAVDVDGVKVLAVSLPSLDAKALRDAADKFKHKLGKSVVLLASVDNEKISLLAGISKDLTGRLKAGDLMREVATKVGGKGGGRPDMAQGGGNKPDALPGALTYVEQWVRQQLKSNE